MRGRVWGPLAIAIALASMTAGGIVVGTRDDDDSGVLANVWVVASGGSPNCTRSATLIDYTAAVSAGAVCGPGARSGGNGSVTSFDNACWAASTGTVGDIVAVKNGDYSQNQANGFLFESGKDCSDGQGADYNPNWKEQGTAEGSLVNWITYIPADDPQDITFVPSSFIFGAADYHMIWKGIDVNTGMKFNYGGESSGNRAKNIIIRGNSALDRANIHGIQVIGSQNILLQHLDYGPSTQCGKANDANVPDAFECDENAPAFESQYADLGTASPGCSPVSPVLCGGWFWNGASEWVEMYIHNGGAGDYLNVRVEDVINHDQQGKQDGAGVHPGCLMSWDYGQSTSTAHNLVLDHYVCERPTGAGIQMGDGGITVQNSVFACQVSSLQNTGGVWDGPCAGPSFGLARKNDGSVQQNVLIRYNVFAGLTGLQIQAGGLFGTHSNVRVVGNLFIGSGTCGIAGVTYNSNAFVSGLGTCGTNSQSLPSGDPIVNSSHDTPDGLYVLDGETLDPSLDGTPTVTALNPTALNTACGCTDYTLDHDFEGDARSSTSTKPGADG